MLGTFFRTSLIWLCNFTRIIHNVSVTQQWDLFVYWCTRYKPCQQQHLFAAIFRLFAFCGEAKVAICAARTCQLAVVSADSAPRDAARSLHSARAARALFNRLSKKRVTKIHFLCHRALGQSANWSVESVNWICDTRAHANTLAWMGAIKKSDANNRFFDTSLIFACVRSCDAPRSRLDFAYMQRLLLFIYIIILVPKSGQEVQIIFSAHVRRNLYSPRRQVPIMSFSWRGLLNATLSLWVKPQKEVYLCHKI